MTPTKSPLGCSCCYSLVAHLALAVITFAAPATQARIVNDLPPTKVSFVQLKAHTETPQAGEMAPVAPPPVEPKREVAPAVKPKPKPEPKPVAKKPKTVKKVEKPAPPKPAPAPQAEEPAPVVTANPAPAARAQGVAGGRGKIEGGNYEQLVLSWLAKHKRYPERARRRNISGQGIIKLVLAPNGEVKDFTIARSTTSSLLDRELRAMVNRANPFPPPPVNYSRETLAFIVPVSFKLQ